MKRFLVSMLLVETLALVPAFCQPAGNPPPTYVIVHGAWGGSWDWALVDSLLSQRGHRVVLTQLTGLGERIHLLSPAIGLETHIADVVNTILWRKLENVILIGHSYGGMVITGVADRIPQRIRRLVYLDAFLPDSGESVQMLVGPIGSNGLFSHVRAGLMIPYWVSDTTAIPRDTPQPLRTFTDTLSIGNPSARNIPGTYILTYEPQKLPDPFQRYADRAAARGWQVVKLQSNHVPERSAPLPLVEILGGIH